MIDTGVAHGRFQLLHNDHLNYLRAAKARCRRLVVGITNPDPTLTRYDGSDPKRSAPENNLLTYYERYSITTAALREEGIPAEDIAVVPLPINIPELYRFYVPLEAVFFLTIYDDWGERKMQMFRSLGLKTEILWRRTPLEKGLTSSEIRRRIVAGSAWEHLVPPATARLLREMDLLDRIRGAAAPEVRLA
jgi:nicotinamide mononucleotide adenylyltransferase